MIRRSRSRACRTWFTLPTVSCVPEFFADTPVINGMAYPELTLPAGVHRFRMLNATQSRVWNLQLYRESAADPGDANLDAKGPDFIQIGTEGGFLPKPVVVPSGNPFNLAQYAGHDTRGYSLVLAGAERADVLINFSHCAGQSFILYNDAPSPFPEGNEADYHTGNGGAPDSTHGPNTRTLMRIRITSAGGGQKVTDDRLLAAVTTELARNQLGLLVDDATIGTVFEAPDFYTRRTRTLNEGWDPYGRLVQILGTGSPSGKDGTVYGMHYTDGLSEEEVHLSGRPEVWDIYNTTGDTHPIHFHLVNVQILGRAPFAQDADGNPVDGAFTPSGAFVPPDANERGFRETVRMNPGEVTRVVMKFDLPPDPVVNVLGRNRRIQVPKSPRTGGYEYVWHCHILEHEEHDMMRPLVVFSAGSLRRAAPRALVEVRGASPDGPGPSRAGATMKRVWSAALVLALVALGFLAGSWASWQAFGRAVRPGTREALYWVDPMHPTYRSDKPGTAPDCGMALEPVYAGDPLLPAGSSLAPGALRVSPEKQQTIGVRVARVQASPFQRTIRTVGRVTVDENRVYRLVASVDGIVRELHPNAAGTFVRQDQVLLTWYSSEFLGAEQAYFYALKTLDRITGDRTEPTEQTILTHAQLRSAVDTLRSLGMTEMQIRELGKTRRLVRDIELRAPVSGYVLSRSVFSRDRVDRGAELYRIADLSHVWVIADLFESDAQVRAGTSALVSFPFPERGADPGPHQQRAAAARSHHPGPQGPPGHRQPRPIAATDMFVDVEIAATLPEALTVPSDAVVDSGLRKLVVRRPRLRLLRAAARRDRLALRRPGRDRQRADGGRAHRRRRNFLLDSERRMKAAAMGIVTAEVDPVCGIEVDQARAKADGRTSVHAGMGYSFCSESCKRRFDAAPQTFLPRERPRRRHRSRDGRCRRRPEKGNPWSRARIARRGTSAMADRRPRPPQQSVGGRTIFATDPVCGAEVEMTAPDAIVAEYAGTTSTSSRPVQKAFERAGAVRLLSGGTTLTERNKARLGSPLARVSPVVAFASRARAPPRAGALEGGAMAFRHSGFMIVGLGLRRG